MSNNLPLSYIELSKSNLLHNISAFKKLAKPGTKFAFVVKGNAYGHGLLEVVRILDPLADFFQVSSLAELESLRKISSKKALLFGYVQKRALAKVLRLNCILSPVSTEQMINLDKIAQKNNVIQEVHLPIDALFGREGFLLDELPKTLEVVKKLKNIKITGVYAHFANIEDTNNFTHAQKQINQYKKALDVFKKFGFRNLSTHISSTSGLLMYEKGRGINPVIRLGIGIYGMWPASHLKFLYKDKITLKPVLSFKTKIAQIKTLPEGYNIGYGLTYMTYLPTKIAVLPVGYADGIDRGLSNKGEVLIRGTFCKILGRISMNVTVVDISHLEEVCTEDEVVIIGSQIQEMISAGDIARKIDTINYEITTRLSPLLPRIVVQ